LGVCLNFFIEGSEAFDYGKNLEKCLGKSARNWSRFYWSFYLPLQINWKGEGK
jgi:hypothetical protein